MLKRNSPHLLWLCLKWWKNSIILHLRKSYLLLLEWLLSISRIILELLINSLLIILKSILWWLLASKFYWWYLKEILLLTKIVLICHRIYLLIKLVCLLYLRIINIWLLLLLWYSLKLILKLILLIYLRLLEEGDMTSIFQILRL